MGVEGRALLDERAEKLKDLRRPRAHSQASHWPLLELGVEVALADQLVRVEEAVVVVVRLLKRLIRLVLERRVIP